MKWIKPIILSAACLLFPVASVIPVSPYAFVTTDTLNKTWYVNRNAQKDGDHEVHVEGCSYLKRCKHCFSLGVFSTCQDALKEARKHFRQVDGCHYCAKECDTD